jgi:hypothetical protein
MVPTPALSTEVERPPRPQSIHFSHGLVMKFEGGFRVIRQAGCEQSVGCRGLMLLDFLDFRGHQVRHQGQAGKRDTKETHHGNGAGKPLVVVGNRFRYPFLNRYG